MGGGKGETRSRESEIFFSPASCPGQETLGMDRDLWASAVGRPCAKACASMLGRLAGVARASCNWPRATLGWRHR